MEYDYINDENFVIIYQILKTKNESWVNKDFWKETDENGCECWTKTNAASWHAYTLYNFEYHIKYCIDGTLHELGLINFTPISMLNTKTAYGSDWWSTWLYAGKMMETPSCIISDDLILYSYLLSDTEFAGEGEMLDQGALMLSQDYIARTKVIGFINMRNKNVKATKGETIYNNIEDVPYDLSFDILEDENGLLGSHVYKYKVMACNPCNFTSLSEASEGTTSIFFKIKVNLTWHVIPGATHYYIFRSDNDAPFLNIGISTSNSYSDSGGQDLTQSWEHPMVVPFRSAIGLHRT